MCDLKVSKCTTSLGMYHSLWDPFSVKVAHLIQKLRVLQQDGPPGPCCHGGCLCVDWAPSSSGENITLLDTIKYENVTSLLTFWLQYSITSKKWSVASFLFLNVTYRLESQVNLTDFFQIGSCGKLTETLASNFFLGTPRGVNLRL